MNDTVSAGLSSYRDRHGKTRWRMRSGGVTFSLPGHPGETAFEEALSAAKAGVRRATTASRRSEIRRSAMLENYCGAALRRARQRASDKGVAFGISPEDFGQLLAQQGWACAVSGMPFALENVDNDRAKNAFRPSLDRIVPALGYVGGNVRIVCEIVNFAMSDWGEGPLLELIKNGRWRT